jgi:hypothetical protein
MGRSSDCRGMASEVLANSWGHGLVVCLPLLCCA